jgi:hypothetical protein
MDLRPTHWDEKRGALGTIDCNWFTRDFRRVNVFHEKVGRSQMEIATAIIPTTSGPTDS